jgi:hypothetical protein
MAVTQVASKAMAQNKFNFNAFMKIKFPKNPRQCHAQNYFSRIESEIKLPRRRRGRASNTNPMIPAAISKPMTIPINNL